MRPVVYVRWFDASYQRGEVTEGELVPRVELETAGLLVREDAETVSVALDWCGADGTWRYVEHIPRVLIMAFFRLKAGAHAVGSGADAKIFSASDPLRNVFESEEDLAAYDANKFEKVEGPPEGQALPDRSTVYGYAAPPSPAAPAGLPGVAAPPDPALALLAPLTQEQRRALAEQYRRVAEQLEERGGGKTTPQAAEAAKQAQESEGPPKTHLQLQGEHESHQATAEAPPPPKQPERPQQPGQADDPQAPGRTGAVVPGPAQTPGPPQPPKQQPPQPGQQPGQQAQRPSFAARYQAMTPEQRRAEDQRLQAMNLEQLRQLADEEGVEVPRRANKDDTLNAIRQARK